MHILFNDKNEDFQCKIQLEGASINNSFARILIESPDFSVVFKGKIDEDGTCRVPMKNLKKLFPTKTNGTIMLEVVADDTYFSPWNDTVEIKPSKTLTVESVQVGEKKSNGPSVKMVEVKNNTSKNLLSEKIAPDVKELHKLIKEVGVTKKILNENKKVFEQPLK